MKIISWLYRFSIWLYGSAIRITTPFNEKARKWLAGRKDWKKGLELACNEGDWIWVHCASLGEFEQGRNVIDLLKEKHPHYRILLTFFSPSGYEIRKNYKHADHVSYLPLDTRKNARTFINITKPVLAIFVKYDLWLNFLGEIARLDIPHILISARVSSKSPFLKSLFSPLYKNAFKNFSAIFTQDQQTKEILSSFSQNPEIHVSYDTRYDRVASNRDQFQSIQEIEAFKKERFCMVAGSSWPRDDELILSTFRDLGAENMCLIIAPHEIHRHYILKQKEKDHSRTLLYSEIDQMNEQHDILWIDNIGMLSKLYYYADLAYVGGGWSGKLHNILEPTVFGCPVIFGPNYKRYPEAYDLIDAKGGFSIKNQEELRQTISSFMKNPDHLSEIHRNNVKFIEEKRVPAC